jgi:hypothetical protein
MIKQKNILVVACILIGGCQSAQTTVENKCLKQGFTADTKPFDQCVNAEMQFLLKQMIEQVNKIEPFLPASPTPGVN